MLHSFVNGSFITASLIIALGAQNAFVLAQSMRREHHIGAALLCILCDVVLISAGVYGLASLLLQSPIWLAAARYGGAAFLALYGFKALQRAIHPSALELKTHSAKSLAQVLLMTLGVTLLNPHVYLDTVLLIGSVGAQQTAPSAYILGASLISCLWFLSLALGAARLAPWLCKPNTWRIIDSGIGCLMLYLALQLVSREL